MMPGLPPDLPWASLALLMLVKPAAVVLAALLVARLLPPRRAAAAARHLVWTLAVGALLLLPAAAVLLPRWEAGWIPAPATFAAPASVPRPAPPDAAASTSADPTDAPFGSPDGGAMEAPAEHPSSLPPLPGTVAVVYLAGLLAVLGWAMAGFVSVRRIARRAAAVTDAAWLGLLRDVAWELDVGRPIRLLQSASSPMPMTWGVRHPAILLPAAAEGWSEEQRRAVLRHEVAHVARRDCLTQAAAAAACVLYWFHPAAWYAARQLRVERELACDDRVLGAGTGARAYAGHLLEVARSFRAPRLVTPATVSMARPSQLEGRMLAVLDSGRRRRPLPRAVAGGAALAALAAVLPLAALAPAQRGDAAPPAGIAGADTAAADPGIPPLPEGPPVEAIVQAVFGETLELRLAAKSEVRITGWDRDAVQVRSWGRAEGDAEGRITL
jgi:bla regulator protein blaR1